MAPTPLHVRHRKTFKDVERLQQHHPAGGGLRHRDDVIAAIRTAHRRADHRLIRFESSSVMMPPASPIALISLSATGPRKSRAALLAIAESVAARSVWIRVSPSRKDVPSARENIFAAAGQRASRRCQSGSVSAPSS